MTDKELEVLENNQYVNMAYDYCKELHSMTGEPLPSVIELHTQYISYIFDSRIVVKKLYKDCNFVGFVIFEKVENEPVEWYLMESYVMPEYRKQGVMARGVYEFIIDHHVKTIGYVTLNENDYANAYWKKLFNEMQMKVERKDEYFIQFPNCRGYVATYEK